MILLGQWKMEDTVQSILNFVFGPTCLFCFRVFTSTNQKVVHVFVFFPAQPLINNELPNNFPKIAYANRIVEIARVKLRTNT